MSAEKKSSNLPAAAGATGSPVVVGAGANRYEAWHNWLVPPREFAWGDTHGLAQDAAGNIYVAHTVNAASMRSDAVLVFGPDGEFRRAFGAEFRGGAHGLACRREPDGEFLYLTDVIRCQFVKLRLSGEVVWRKGYPHEVPMYADEPTAFCPTNVAFAPDGGFFLADGYGSSHVLRYDRDGNYLGSVGRPGRGEGEFDCPHGIAVDLRGAEPRLVVADRGNARLQTFTLGGRYLQTIKDESRLRMPCHFDIRGDLMVCPDLDSQVCLLDRNLAVIAQLGDGRAANGPVGSRRWRPRAEFEPGKFITPHSAIFLHDGDLLVAEWLVHGRITRLHRI